MLSFISLTLFLLSASRLQAFEVPVTCKTEIDQTGCAACAQKKSKAELSGLLNLGEKLSLPILQYQQYEKRAKELNAANQVLKNKLASMFRSLRDGKSEPTYDLGMIEVNKVRDDFKRLTILAKEANILQKKFNICLNNCSPVRRLEIVDDLKKIQKLKIAVLISQPILANKEFENMFLNMPDQFVDSEKEFSTDQFQGALKNALFDNLQVILKKNDEYSNFRDDYKKPILKTVSPDVMKKYNEDLISRYPMISEDIAKEIAVNIDKKPEFNSPDCSIVNQFKKYTTRKEYKELALDVGLFALPFAFGPVGRLGGISAELMFGEKLVQWGLKGEQVANAMRATDFTFQVGLVAHEASGIVDKYKTCQKSEADFLTNSSEIKLNELNQCKKDLSDRIFYSELSSIALATSSIAPKAIKLLKATALQPKAPQTVSLLFKDFGGGKNKIIKSEIDKMLDATKAERSALAEVSNEQINKRAIVEKFEKDNKLTSEKGMPNIIPKDKLAEYQEKIGKDTVELLYIPGSEIPFLPNSVNKVGHIAFRIGDKVYHQTGGSGFKIETFENFLGKTKEKYKVFGQVMQVSEKEKLIMESYFKKMYEKQLPYSFLVNNCSQAVCRAMKLSDFEKTPALTHDPILTKLKLERSERVVMKTMYNADKDLTVSELKKATLNNRLAFYGIPAAAGASAAIGSYEAVDFVIEYLNQSSRNNDLEK